VIVITQEKTIHDVGTFDKGKLKHTETAEKVVLPDQQGTFNFFFLSKIVIEHKIQLHTGVFM